MTRLLLVAPLGILFAWSGPWTCATYTLPDGGSTPFNPNVGPPDGGGQSGAAFAQDASVTYNPNAGGQSGLAPGPGGGVTVGAAANFSTNFVYMSNSADGTISRILIPTSGAPYEQARYYCITPVDNHGQEPMTGGHDIWQAAGVQQLNPPNGGYNSPSRTLVDRNGNVWVALRAPGYQAGATKIVDVGDHLAACTPRCNQRAGLAPGQPLTEGIALTSSTGASLPALTPPQIIAAGTSYSTSYYCEDPGSDYCSTSSDCTSGSCSASNCRPGTASGVACCGPGTSMRDARNYDDCIAYSIPLGDPHPDPNADPGGTTLGTSFGRAAAISPHCDPYTAECDVWIGMWNGATWVVLGEAAPSGGAAFDVSNTVYTGVDPYGASVDCAGVIWGVGASQSGGIGLSATTTVAVNDPSAGLALAPYQVLTTWNTGSGTQYGVPNTSQCAFYGISSDLKERVWIAGGSNGARACSFDATQLLANYSNIVGLPGSWSTLQSAMKQAWRSYDFRTDAADYNDAYARGINVDKNGNVYVGVDLGPWNGGQGNGAAGLSFNPDCPDGGASSCPASGTSAKCYLTSSGTNCQVSGEVNWAFSDGSPMTHGNGTVGVDLDANGNPWFGSYGAALGTGVAMQLDPATGTPQSTVNVGHGVYSYSDFSGYALRNITLATGAYSQAFQGCLSAPEFTTWQAVGYDASTPPGTDIAIQVVVTNSLDPAVIQNLTPVTICNSVQSGSCGNPISLQPFNLPGGQYLLVEALLIPKICSANGGASALDKPTLYGLNVVSTCPGS